MAKKRSPKIETPLDQPPNSTGESDSKDAPKEQPSVRDRIQALLDELTDAELNILIYEIENPKEARSMEKLGRIASHRLRRPKAIKQLTNMLIDYYIERHPRLESHYLIDRYHLQEYFYDHCM